MLRWELLLVLIATIGWMVDGQFYSIPLVPFGSAPQASQQVNTDAPSPSEPFPYNVQLNDDYFLFWDFNDTHITFETIVKTAGWVGFGISPNGAMTSSDVVIGWVKNDRVHFSDRYAEGQFMPTKDDRQNWRLLMGQESGEYTILKMMRRLETCDDRDRPILGGTTRVIYAYSPIDPSPDDAIAYHDTNRGTKSLLLLDPPASEKSSDDLPSDTQVLEFRNRNLSVPSTDTTYWCTVWKAPDLGGKHHVFKYDAVIDSGHENLLHHIILYFCSGSLTETSFYPNDFNCYTNEQNPETFNCVNVLAAWAIGGQAFNYPAHVGFSLGAGADPGFFMMETHYDNPSMRSDYVDNSGVILYLTKQLRQHDSGVIQTGLNVDYNHLIPPNESAFLSQGFCHERCLTEALEDKEIYAFANMLHAHLLGVKLRTRHFRNGVELPPLQEDNNYDFNYQESRLLLEERTIKKGDSFLVECEYDSTERTRMTSGGLSTREEMCLSFIYYYPKVTLSRCVSSLQYEIPTEYLGSDLGSTFNYINSLNWSQPETHTQFEQIVTASPYVQYCSGEGTYYNVNFETLPALQINPPFQRPQMCPA